MAVLIRKCSLLLPGFRTTSYLTVVLLVCMETVFLCTESTCSKSFQVHWNTTNSIFRIDNTDHIIDVNKGNVQFEYDQVNIICPVYTPGTYGDDLEKYIIYNVSKEEYETCRITNSNPRIIAICDKPYKLMYFTITFRPFTPQPEGLEFLPGKDYYFISTSSKDDLHRRIGGRCSSNNMKIVFKVCCAPNENQNTNNNHHNNNTIKTSSSTIRITSTTTTTTTTTTIRNDRQSIEDIITTPSSTTTQWLYKTEYTRKPTKKINEYDKHPNEVMKNEELTYSHGVRFVSTFYLIVFLVFLTLVIRWR